MSGTGSLPPGAGQAANVNTTPGSLPSASQGLPLQGTGHLLAYVTAGDLDEAKRLAHGLVEARLAACVNILPNMTSVYSWQGEIQEDEEVVLVVKTRASHAKRLVSFIRAHHSYETPAVVLLPVVAGNPDFLVWIDEETGPLPEPNR